MVVKAQLSILNREALEGEGVFLSRHTQQKRATQEFINQKRTTCGNALFEESEGVAVALLPNLRVM